MTFKTRTETQPLAVIFASRCSNTEFLRQLTGSFRVITTFHTTKPSDNKYIIEDRKRVRYECLALRYWLHIDEMDTNVNAKSYVTTFCTMKVSQISQKNLLLMWLNPLTASKKWRDMQFFLFKRHQAYCRYDSLIYLENILLIMLFCSQMVESLLTRQSQWLSMSRYPCGWSF